MDQSPAPVNVSSVKEETAKRSQEILTVQEAARMLRVSRSTVWRWCKDGTLHSAFKIGRNWRVHRSELERIIG